MHGPSIVVVHHVFRPDAAFQVLEVGAQLPMYASALGKAMLAYLPGEVVDDLTEDELPKLTSKTLSPKALRAELVGVLNAGPQASGFDGGWTIARVAMVIRRRFGVLYRYPSAVWTLLHRLGFSVQKPARRAVERDEAAINRWRTQTWSQVLEWPPPAGHGSATPTSPVSA